MFGVQHAFQHLRRVRNRHHNGPSDQLWKCCEHGVRNNCTPILPNKMHRFAPAQQPYQLGDIGGERGFVIKAILRDLGRVVAAQVGRDRAVAGGSKR